MKVYVLKEAIEWEGEEIYGVFSTKEKAIEYKRKMNKYYRVKEWEIVPVEMDKGLLEIGE